ncbi:MAG TPA: alpha/beta hydrolase [Gemmatimonadales bacterium]|nr:alpha/beta hydrolase [Gemmatimonadales bacterium]
MNPASRTFLLLGMLLQGACHPGGGAPASAASGSPPEREGYVDAGKGVRLYYRTAGTGRDTVIVLHGGPGFNMEYFAKDLTPLAESHTLLFYDQRGAGRSTLVTDSAALDAQRFADDLEAVRRHFGMERVTLLGHSWGPAVAALYAARYPERIGRLVLVGTLPPQQKQLLQAFQELAAGRDSATRAGMETWMKARTANPGDGAACRAYYALWFIPFFADTADMGRSRGDFCAGSPASLRNKMASVDRFVFPSLGEWDWRPVLRRVNAPALVVHGSADPLPLDGARDWAETLPKGRLVLLEGIGHFPYLEAPETFFPIVEEFLRGS